MKKTPKIVNQRKVNTMVMLTEKEIEYLDSKINKKVPELASRSAILRHLVRHALENPSILRIKA